MLIPFFSSSGSKSKSNTLTRRKGGGAHSGGRSGGSSSSKSSGGGSKGGSGSSAKPGPFSSGSSSSGSLKSKSQPITSSSGGTTLPSTTYSNPRPIAPVSIPAGQPFAGRLQGGGTRAQIFGTKTYGSGYPGVVGRGTAGRNFPFIFWPIAWPAAVGGGVAAGLYLSNHDEYGSPSNTSRPGGQLSSAFFTTLTNSSSTTPSTFRILSDNTTISSLIPDILTNCSTLIHLPSSSNVNQSTPYAGAPLPEQVIQYYRASSLALSLDGYNNTATYSSSPNTTDTSLPTTMSLADSQLMDCLNQTIAQATPLIGGAGPNLNLNLSGFTFSALGVWWVLLWMFIL